MKRVMLPDIPVAAEYDDTLQQHQQQGTGRIRLQPGDYVAVLIHGAGNANLFGTPLARTGMSEFARKHGSMVPVGAFWTAQCQWHHHQRDPEGTCTPKGTGSWEHRQEARVRLRDASALPVAFQFTG